MGWRLNLQCNKQNSKTNNQIKKKKKTYFFLEPGGSKKKKTLNKNKKFTYNFILGYVSQKKPKIDFEYRELFKTYRPIQ